MTLIRALKDELYYPTYSTKETIGIIVGCPDIFTEYVGKQEKSKDIKYILVSGPSILGDYTFTSFIDLYYLTPYMSLYPHIKRSINTIFKGIIIESNNINI